MYRIRPTFLLVSISLLLACQNDEDTTPSIDADVGTMKMTMDGTTMTSSPNSPAHATLRDTYGYIIGYFEISAGEYVQVAIFVQDIKSGVFPMDGNTNRQSKVWTEYYPSDGLGFYGSYNSSKTVAGKVTITQFDKGNRVISGVFEVEVARASEPKIVTITKASFNQLPID